MLGILIAFLKCLFVYLIWIIILEGGLNVISYISFKARRYKHIKYSEFINLLRWKTCNGFEILWKFYGGTFTIVVFCSGMFDILVGPYYINKILNTLDKREELKRNELLEEN